MRTSWPVEVFTIDPMGNNMAKSLKTNVKATTVKKALGSQYASNFFGNFSKGKTGLQLDFVHNVWSEMRISGHKAIKIRLVNHSKLKFRKKPKRPPFLATAWLGLGVALGPCVSSSSVTASRRAAMRADWRVGVTASGLGAVNAADFLQDIIKVF